MNEEKNEKRIVEALSLQESGARNAEILQLFPDIKDELSDIFQLQATLKIEKELMMPRQELLSKILAKIPGPALKSKEKAASEIKVSNPTVLRSRVPVASPFMKEISVSVRLRRFMYAAPVAALAVIVLVLGVRGGKDTPSEVAMIVQDSAEPQMETVSLKQAAPHSATGVADMGMASEYILPPATGNVDEAVAAIISDSDVEQQTLAQHDQASLAGNDTGLINDLDQVDQNAY